MRIFVTGATGFIGTELVKELIAAGNQVRGLARSDSSAQQLESVGAEVHRGNLQDLESLRSGAAGMDAVVNLAFNHEDMSKFAQHGEDERHAIEALGSVLEPGKLLVVTSGTGLASGGPGHLRVESDPPMSNEAIPRQPEDVARAVADRGVRVAIVRLPQVHDTRKQGLVPYFLAVTRQKGISAYIADGSNRWPAAHVSAVAQLYRLAFEKAEPGSIYHAVDEEGVTMKEIAEAHGRGLNVPVVSIRPEEAEAQFGWLAQFAALDMPSSSVLTQAKLNWKPTGPGLIVDLDGMDYSQA